MTDWQEFLERTKQLQGRCETLESEMNLLRADLDALSQQAVRAVAEGGRTDEPLTVSAPAPEKKPAEEPPAPPAADASHRRSVSRRKGNPVALLLDCPEVSPAHFHGLVDDRSPEGVRLLTDREVPAGTHLKVQPVFVSARWFPVEVRYCRPEGNLWALGCKFTDNLSWEEWHLFN